MHVKNENEKIEQTRENPQHTWWYSNFLLICILTVFDVHLVNGLKKGIYATNRCTRIKVIIFSAFMQMTLLTHK